MKTYKPKDIDNMDIYEVRSAYQSMRKAINKRITNLEKRGIITTHHGGRYNKTGGLRFSTDQSLSGYRFPAASELDNEELRIALADISLWARDPAHTVKGEKREREFIMQQFHKKGYDFVNDSNFYDVLAYMDRQREIYGDKVFDSSAALDVYEVAERVGMDPDVLAQDFDYFKKHVDALEKMQPVRSQWGGSWAGIKDKVRKIEKRK